MQNYSEIISQLLIIIAVLVALVNIVTEVVKKIYAFKTTEGLNIFVTILSIVTTCISLIAYWQINNLAFAWYIVLAFVVVGFMVAYAAMFGFDKLIKYFEDIKK